MTPNQEEPRLPPKPPMSPFSPSGDIDYIPMSPLAIALRETYTPTEFKSKGVKKVLGVVAMIAIPFAAPAISGAIATSGFLGATASAVAGTWVGSAIVGAGLGAVTAKITGGDPLMGALGGAIGGGLGGVAKGMATPTWLGGSGTAAASTAPLTTAEQLANAAAQGGGPPGSVAMAGPGVVGAPVVAPTFVQQMGTGFKNALTSQAAVQGMTKMSTELMMSAFMPENYDDEQLQLIEQHKKTIERLEAQGEAVDGIKMTQARSLLQQALQVDPTYLARQKEQGVKNQYALAANKAQRDASQAGLRPTYAANEARRIQLAGTTAGASAYDQGYITGITEKGKMTQAGLQALPTTTGLPAYYTSLAGMYQGGAEDLEEEKKGYRELFGDIYASGNEENRAVT